MTAIRPSMDRPQRVLLAPVTVSPTKPLTPTHLKYLLSLDMIFRATGTFADVTWVYDHAAYWGSQQVSGFWGYLDRFRPGLAYDRLTEEEIGELYLAFHQQPASTGARPRALLAGPHPVSSRLLDLWEQHYRLLGIYDPALGRSGPPLAAEAEIIDLLTSRGLCIDGRPFSAPVYLDATAAGLPLRAILGPGQRANYLLCVLQQLVPLLSGYDLVVLAHDTELRSDYRTIQYVLSALGATVTRFEVPRVPLDGTTCSTRFGGWQGYTMSAFAEQLTETFGTEAFRLGLRLYLVAGLGRTAGQSFSVQHLRRWTGRAAKLLAEQPGCEPDDVGTVAEYLRRLAGRPGYPDPYRMAAALAARDGTVPTAGLLRTLLAQGAVQVA